MQARSLLWIYQNTKGRQRPWELRQVLAVRSTIGPLLNSISLPLVNLGLMLVSKLVPSTHLEHVKSRIFLGSRPPLDGLVEKSWEKQKPSCHLHVRLR